MKLPNYHTHTHFSDGKLAPGVYVTEAMHRRLSGIGFSEHAPLPLDCGWAMPAEKSEAYAEEIQGLKNKFAGRLDIFCALEVDYIPGMMSVEHPSIKKLPLDYTIGSVHYVDAFEDGTPWAIDGTRNTFSAGLEQIFQNDIRLAVQRYYELTREMVSTACPTIVAHLDRLKKNNPNQEFFSEEEEWYQKAITETLESIAESGAIMEINTKGHYRKTLADTYPSRWILRQAREMNIPVHLASDAHHPKDMIAGFAFGRQNLAAAGYEEVRLLIEGTWQAVPLTAFEMDHETKSVSINA